METDAAEAQGFGAERGGLVQAVHFEVAVTGMGDLLGDERQGADAGSDVQQARAGRQVTEIFPPAVMHHLALAEIRCRRRETGHQPRHTPTLRGVFASFGISGGMGLMHDLRTSPMKIALWQLTPSVENNSAGRAY